MEDLKPCKRGNHYKHGYSITHPALMNMWQTMKSRCNNPNREKYKDYGARGIKLCEEWECSAENFCNWALSNGYEKGLQIDRIDNNGNYEPSNCRFVTPKQNSRNRRNTVYLTINEEIKSVAEWSEVTGVNQNTIYWWVKNKGKEYAEKRIKDATENWNRRATDADNTV